MHRMILTSATYRQSSRMRPDLVEADPENRRLARQSRLRVDAELVRDAALVAGGLLVSRVGGPSVFPPQPDGVMSLGQIRREWKTASDEDRYRRGLYTHFWRATPHPLLAVFDAPDATLACTRRARSNTPLQALLLLNDEAFFECAQALARRVLEDGHAEDVTRIDQVFRIALSRTPSDAERGHVLELLRHERGAPNGDADGLDGSSSSRRLERGTNELAAWTSVARSILNLDEFITRE